MNEELYKALQDLIASATDTSIAEDLVVVSKIDFFKVKECLKHTELGTPIFFEPSPCKKCGSPLEDGFCTDIACTYSDWGQDIPEDLFLTEATTIDIVDECHRLGIPVRIQDEEKRASNDLFECVVCKYVFDIEQSVKWPEGLLCLNCNGERDGRAFFVGMS